MNLPVLLFDFPVLVFQQNFLVGLLFLIVRHRCPVSLFQAELPRQLFQFLQSLAVPLPGFPDPLFQFFLLRADAVRDDIITALGFFRLQLRKGLHHRKTLFRELCAGQAVFRHLCSRTFFPGLGVDQAFFRRPGTG